MGVSKTLKTYKTPLTADCVEFCPIPGLQHLLICGNYQLESGETSDRIGKLSLHDLTAETLNPISFRDTDAVLDIKFQRSPASECAIFCSVESTGHFRLWSVDEKEVKPVFSKQLSESEILLSCDWSERTCAVSTSGGAFFLLNVSESDVDIKQQWKSHDHEAWIVAFDGVDKNILYSGSDDCTLRKHDLRIELGKGQMIGRRGDMGVTSIQAHPIDCHLFASGSYDETVKLWDSRSLRSPVEEIAVGGGAWRLKWEPNSGKHLLVGAMHNGFQMLAFNDKTLKLDGRYMKHESLAYGCDWYSGSVSELRNFIEVVDGDFVVATCSMYDCALHTWLWNPDGCKDET